MTEVDYIIKLKVHTTLQGDLEKIAIESGNSVDVAVMKAMEKYKGQSPQICSGEPLKI